MTHIKVMFSPAKESRQEGCIYFQLSKDRKVRRVATSYRIEEWEWDKRNHRISLEAVSDGAIYAREGVRLDRERMGRIVDSFERSDQSYSLDDVIDEFTRQRHDYTVVNFMKSLISSMHKRGKIRTSETYLAALNSFRRFVGNDDLMLDALTRERIGAYESFLLARGVTLNTVSFCMRILRATYNRAVELGVVIQQMPFKHVYTGVGKTVKRALALDLVRLIRNLDLEHRHSLDYARDMFMMSFYMRGMSLVDMAFLCKSDLRNGYLTYRRRKTGQQLTIAWTAEMQDIIDKYPSNPTHYLLPIICNKRGNERKIYRNVSNRINYSLKKIAMMIGAPITLTMYCARHSWATAARVSGVPVGVISQGLGHNSESTTRIYLASFDTTAVDGANERIIKTITG